MCVFHAPKLSHEQRAVLTQDGRERDDSLNEEFRRGVREMIATAESTAGNASLLFTGFVFPDFELRDVRLERPVSFDAVTFTGPVKMTKVAFLAEVSFVNAHFRERADFFQCSFTDATFNPTQFDTYASFCESVHGRLNFSNARFESGAGFSESFIRHGMFDGTVFKEGPTFQNVTFEDEAYFEFANVQADTAFREVLFTEGADFAVSEFGGTTEFDRVRFGGHAEFGGSTVDGRLEFSPDDPRCFEAGASFPRLRLDSKAVLAFQRVDLSEASFLWTNLETAVLQDVTWRVVERRVGPLRFSSVALYDEFPDGDAEPDFAPLALNYRQLVLNYEAQRDHETAEHFYVRGMEVRRKQLAAGKAGASGYLPRWLNGYALYLILSRYGSSYQQSIAVLAAMVALTALIFLGVGFRAVGSAPDDVSPVGVASSARAESPARVIQYGLWTSPQHPVIATPQEWLADYGHAAILAVSILTPQRGRPYEPISPLGWLTRNCSPCRVEWVV
ncbi:MAG: hypothetical protein M3N47_09360, partial [Chloroflexota bacterium]|nr:hypothetical protein [Chloroflexota bacterium]